MKRFYVLAVLLSLTACSTGIPVEKYNSLPAAPEKFSICHGYSCTYKSEGGFSKSEWAKITGIFKSKSKTAEAERSKIAKAIALMEVYTGKKTGTDIDTEAAVSSKSDGGQLEVRQLPARLYR